MKKMIKMLTALVVSGVIGNCCADCPCDCPCIPAEKKDICENQIPKTEVATEENIKTVVEQAE